MCCKKLRYIALCLACTMLVMVLPAGCRTGGQKDGNNDAGGTNAVPGRTAASSISLDSAGEAAPVFKVEKERNSAAVEFNPVKYQAKVKYYKVKDDLSNIVNLAQFGSFTEKQRKMLAQNGFVVTPSEEEQLFYIYETNEYLKLPGFVTTDSVLQVYHVFFDYSLRKLESEKLLGALEQLTASMLAKSVEIYNRIQNPQIKAEAFNNIAYFGVAQLALQKELPADMPEEAKDLAIKEFEHIRAMKGFEDSALFPFQLDYSQYRPRGHYTRSEELERYFTAMMWYGQAPFRLFVEKDGKKQLDTGMTIRALLITYCAFLQCGEVSDIALWDKIYDPTVFYVGKADDLTLYDYGDLLVKVYGSKPDLEALMENESLERLFKEAERLPEPQIQAKWVTVNTPSEKQFRFMGQRYIPDSEILQELVEPYKRPMPSGLDVMGVLGSERAYGLLTDRYRVQEQWDQYPKKFRQLREKFSRISPEKWRSNMYYGWLWVLKSLISPFDSGYPTFMTNTAWQDKSLNTALGSWSELRHDTVLYGKQSGAEAGGDIPPKIKGYVEPNIGVYEKLLWLTRYSRENLKYRQLLPEDLEDRMLRFEELLNFLIGCSAKELRNEELSEEEYRRLLNYGATLEFLTSSLAGDHLRWFEITSETDKNMAVITDVHTVPGHYLEAGVGTAAQIFVVVPIGGKLYLTRGAVFSYYEFVSGLRLTDEEWQKMLKDKRQPARPDWTETFEADEKQEIPAPVPG